MSRLRTRNVTRSRFRWAIVVTLTAAGMTAWWLTKTADRVATVSAGAMIEWVGFAADGTTIVTLDRIPQRGRMRFWEWDSGRGIHPRSISATSRLGTAAVALQGSQLACPDPDGEGVILWDVAADREGRLNSALGDPVRLAVSPDRARVAFLGDDIRVVDVPSDSVIATFAGDTTDRFTLMKFGANGKEIIAGSEGGRLIVHGVDSGRPISGREGLPQIAGFDVSPDGSELAIGDRSGTIHVFSYPALEPRRTLRPNGREPIQAVAYSPGGGMLGVASGWDYHPWPGNPAGRVTLFARGDYSVKKTLAWFWGVPRALAFSPDGRHVAVGTWVGNGGTVDVWRVED